MCDVWAVLCYGDRALPCCVVLAPHKKPGTSEFCTSGYFTGSISDQARVVNGSNGIPTIGMTSHIEMDIVSRTGDLLVCISRQHSTSSIGFNCRVYYSANFP